MRKRAPIVIALGGMCLTSTAQAQETEAPDLDFLEYLGSWQAEDDEWLVIAEWENDNARKDEDKGEAEDANDTKPEGRKE